MLATLVERLHTTLLDPWVLFGFAAQGCFAFRFIWQWFVSEKRGKSTIPIGFWFFSLIGGAMLFVYAVRQGDPVFIAGQGLGLVIYSRNLMLIYGRRRPARPRRPQASSPVGEQPAPAGAAEEVVVS